MRRKSESIKWHFRKNIVEMFLWCCRRFWCAFAI